LRALQSRLSSIHLVNMWSLPPAGSPVRSSRVPITDYHAGPPVHHTQRSESPVSNRSHDGAPVRVVGVLAGTPMVGNPPHPYHVEHRGQFRPAASTASPECGYEYPVEHDYFDGKRRNPKSALDRLSPYFCEFIGSFIVVFTIACCNLNGSKTWNATAVACVLMVSVYAVFDVSGGNLNPAVSLCLGLCKKLHWPVVAGYIGVQVLAGIFAATFSYLIFPQPMRLVRPNPPFRGWHVALVEILFTAMLCFVAVNCTASERNHPKLDKNHFFGLAVGFVLVAGGYSAGEISGAVFNPAAALSLAFPNLYAGVCWGLTYVFFEAIGAVLAAAAFYVCRPEDFFPLHRRSTQVIEDFVPALPTRCVAEFLGTFMLALTVCLNLVMSSATTAWAAAAALMCMVYALGNVSGGHFNPAVTLAVVLSGRDKCSARIGLAYVVVQFLAALLVGWLVQYIHFAGPYYDEEFGLMAVGAHRWWPVFFMESIFTFVLAFVVLAVATVTPSYTSSRMNYFGLAIGMCVAVGGFAAGSISGGILNPAVALSITTEAKIHWGFGQWPMMGGPLDGVVPVANVHHAPQFRYWLWWSLAEVVGALLAAGAFHLTHPREYEVAALDAYSKRYDPSAA